jgi:hypothetical protein
MPFRVAADVLQHVLPIDAGKSPATMRSHTLRVGKQLADAAAEKAGLRRPDARLGLCRNLLSASWLRSSS